MQLYKYQGAGNDFLIADNRSSQIKISSAEIQRLCDRRYGIGADGMMLLESEPGYDFRMTYYNSDASTGMMCGNGGRCIVAFADSLMHKDTYRFVAADGAHTADIVEREGALTIVRLGMRDVAQITAHPDLKGCFLDTGTRHFVTTVDDIDSVDVVKQGRAIRYDERFAPVGVNVNFAQWRGDTLHVRTYEKGVEDETYACGTGITASAIAAMLDRHGDKGARCHAEIQALRDRLSVDFTPTPEGATDVSLTGPATLVAQIITP